MSEQQQQSIKRESQSLDFKRWLSLREASDYCGESERGFKSSVKKGIWPDPHYKDNGYASWDKRALDIASDKLSNIGDHNDDEERAALAAIH